MIPALVIFDCDGVLVDSEPISGEVLARVLSECGLVTSTEEAILAMGRAAIAGLDAP